MRLIDADTLENHLERGYKYLVDNKSEIYLDGYMHAWLLVRKFPTIDAKPVVRCKDCASRATEDCAMLPFLQNELDSHNTEDDDFCSYSKRATRMDEEAQA